MWVTQRTGVWEGSGFVYKRGGGYFGQDPPTQLWTHPPDF